MKECLKKIKLLEHLTTELEIPKNVFVSNFKQAVDEGSTGLFTNSFEVFSSSNNEYKGQVGYEGFKIKRRRKLFDMSPSTAVASGTYRQHQEKLIIETEINAFSGMMIPLFVLLIFMYTIAIGSFIVADQIEGNAAGVAIPFLILHAIFMFGIFYLLMRRSAKRMKYELERELYYTTKK